ncbi:PAS domain S-box protein [Agaribacterium sp. ZY112]|uniref:PAS domain S-box protein n=1 Tax=Agaribacterium sp. ZY112 TaxID=3233574 RepID=UPI003525863B
MSLNTKIIALALLCVLPVMLVISLLFYEQQSLLGRDKAMLKEMATELVIAELERELVLREQVLEGLLSKNKTGDFFTYQNNASAQPPSSHILHADNKKAATDRQLLKPSFILTADVNGRLLESMEADPLLKDLQQGLTQPLVLGRPQLVFLQGKAYLLLSVPFQPFFSAPRPLHAASAISKTAWLLSLSELGSILTLWFEQHEPISFRLRASGYGVPEKDADGGVSVDSESAASMQYSGSTGIVFNSLASEGGEISSSQEFEVRGLPFKLDFNGDLLKVERVAIFPAMIALLLFLCVALAGAVHYFLIRRVNELNDVAKAYASGDYDSRVKARGDDEIAQLGYSLNGMCAEISQAQLYLKKMVEVRTQEAKQAVERLHAILSSVNDAIISINVDGEILSFNRSAERIFAYTEKDILGKSVNLLMPFTFSVKHDAYVKNSHIEPNHRHNIWGKERKLEGKRQTGETFPVSIAVTRVCTDGDVFYTSVIRDLSEQQATERKLAEKERLFNTAIHTSSQPFIIMSADGKLMEVNQAMCSWLGYELEDLMLQRLPELVSDKHRVANDSCLSKMRIGELTTVVREEQYIRRDECLVWGLMSATAVQDEQGAVALLVAQITDIDESKRLALELEQRNKELERSNSDLDQFAYIASHDLKSPLNAIKKIVSWIEEDGKEQLSEVSLDNIHLLKNRTDRMMTLLNDLLLYSKVGRFEREPECVELHTLCSSIFDILDKPEDFDLQVEEFELCVPRVPFELVLRNLMSNAIKHYEGSGGRLHISVGRQRGFYVLRVADNGPGIAPELQNKALEMFQTLKPRDTTEGSGMGLALVKKTVEYFNGSLEIDSDGQRGTTMVVYWPELESVAAGK